MHLPQTACPRMQVTSIDSSKPGSIVVAVQGKGTLTARRVVVAVPLGVLQKGAIHFLPSGLAPANEAALGQLGMGLLNKVGLCAFSAGLAIGPAQQGGLMCLPSKVGL